MGSPLPTLTTRASIHPKSRSANDGPYDRASRFATPPAPRRNGCFEVRFPSTLNEAPRGIQAPAPPAVMFRICDGGKKIAKSPVELRDSWYVATVGLFELATIESKDTGVEPREPLSITLPTITPKIGSPMTVFGPGASP